MPDEHRMHVSDELLLAAVDRAERHRSSGGPGPALYSRIVQHLGLPPGAGSTARVMPVFVKLEAEGLLERSKLRGGKSWGLTAAGRRKLRRAGVVELPESPQHQTWRNARTLAEQEMYRMRETLRVALADSLVLLKADAPVSDEWFALAERLKRAAWQVGSATHCLYEWPEPNDARADVDDQHDSSDEQFDPDERGKRRGRRTGRRNTTLWNRGVENG